MKAAIPAADSKWPRFVFTDPNTNGAEPSRSPKTSAQRAQFDRIAQRGASAVRLDVVNLRGLQPRRRQRRAQHACWAGPLGTVSPLLGPSWLTAEPRTTASTESPSRSASLSRLSTTTPQPSPRTYPSAAASKVLQRPSGANIPHREVAMLLSGLSIKLTPAASA